MIDILTEREETSLRWQECNREGWIPGPDETEEAFGERMAFCRNLTQKLAGRMGEIFPFQAAELASPEWLQEVLPMTEALYGIRPHWVPLFFSNRGLAPWHGGCAWIFQWQQDTPMAAVLQLRARFRFSSLYLGLYQRSELIAHELAHVGRMLYEEPQFEEMLAYRSSSSRWRRWWGPLVQSSRESLLFISVLGIVVLAHLLLLFLPFASFMAVSSWMECVPFVFLLLASIRLFYRHHVFTQCARRLKQLYPSSNRSDHLLYRLTDGEIRAFARLSPEQIQHFMEKAARASFRWRFLKAVYGNAGDFV